jgi:hypothetical protein
LQALGVEVAFQPPDVDVIVQQIGETTVDHSVILPHLAR